MRWFAVVLWMTACPAWAQTDLHTCRVYLTGSDTRSRPAGLNRCVRDVLVKLSGDPALAEEPRLDTLRGEDLVQDFAYLDRMSHLPTHDEQGTRDRPFDLIGHVDPAGAEALLATLGRTIWPDRPVLLVRATIQQQDAPYPLTADGQYGERQRQAVLAAGEKFGMRVSLLTYAQATGPALDLDRLPIGRVSDGTVAVLDGSLRWSEAAGGWVCAWALDGQRWGTEGVSFDEGFRAGVGGAAQRLSSRR